MKNSFGVRGAVLTALVLSIGLGGALVPSGQADGARASTGACQPSGSKTVLANSGARLYSKRATNSDNDDVTVLFGCRSGGKPVRMASRFAGAAEERFFGSARLAGRFASVVSFGSNRGNEPMPQELRVFDLRQRTRTALAMTEPGAFVSDVELQRTGSVAYIEASSTNPTVTDPDTFEVAKREAGTTTVLDSGPEIGPDSLAVSGTTVYWTNGLQAKSARLR